MTNHNENTNIYVIYRLLTIRCITFYRLVNAFQLRYSVIGSVHCLGERVEKEGTENKQSIGVIGIPKRRVSDCMQYLYTNTELYIYVCVCVERKLAPDDPTTCIIQ